MAKAAVAAAGRTIDAPQVSIDGNVLVIELPLKKSPTPSASGKTMICATTGGNMRTDAEWAGSPLIVGVNAYIKPEEAVEAAE